MEPAKACLSREVETLAAEIWAISEFLYANPEVAFQEFKACDFLGKILRKHGFEVESPVGGLKTAFLARPKGRGKARPTVALLAEYDALPGVGHGCGHNLIAAASVGAALALSRSLDQIPGGIAVVGTPAEEGGGGKILLAEAGIFAEMDMAMMCHPSRLNLPGEDMLGRIKFRIEFFGKEAHASASPDRGINALDALVLAYNNLNAMRQALRPDARIHGIITHGGEAPNVIPHYTAGLFYVRAATRRYMDEIFQRVEKCVKGAALATGAQSKIEILQPSFDPMKRNPPLEEAVQANMGALGICVDPDDGRRGSSDIGNLSHYLPAIHPSLAIVSPDTAGHSQAFAEATMTPRARETLLKAAKLLAMTAYDYLNSAGLQKSAREAFQREG